MKAYAMGWGLSALVVCTAVVIGGGCGNDVATFPSGGVSGATDTATIGSTTGSNGMGGAGGAGMGGASMSSGSGMSSGTSMSSGLTTSGSSMTSGSGMSSGGMSGSTTGGGTCSPAPGDTACVDCAKTSCCADYQACTASANCICWTFCLSQPNADPQACAGQCGAPDGTTKMFGQCVGGACQAPCTGGGTTGSSAASSSAASSSAAATTAASSGSGSSSAAGSGSSSSASTGTGGNVCPPDPNDGTCAACAKAKCCNEATACAADPKCGCWVQCVAMNPNNPFICAAPNKCGAPDATTTNLSTCTNQNCQGSCP